MKTVFGYLSAFKKRMTVGLSIKVIATLFELMLPLILTHILENVIVEMRVEKIIIYGLVMIGCAVIACVTNVTANRMAARVSVAFSEKLRMDLFKKTLLLSAADTDRYTVASLEARITTDTYNVHSFINMMQRMGVRAPMLLIGGMAISFFMDPYLALVMLAIIPFIFVTVFFISSRGVPMYARVQRSVDDMVRVVREDVQGIRVIKALSKGEYENRRYDEVNRALSHNERLAGIVMGAANPIMTMLMNLGIAGVVALSAVRVANYGATPTAVIAFMQYFTLISMAMMSLSRIFVMYTKCAASAKRIGEVLSTPESLLVNKYVEKRDTGAYIRFDNVSFSYYGRRDDLKNISFSLGRGEHLGIIGSTGSGKSTLTKLLMRFYDTGSGIIEIDGRPIDSFEKDELTAKFGVSMQYDFLMADTVMENIRFGRDIPDSDVIRAAKIAQAHDFISATPDGYSHVLTQKGSNLSGGQRQRLLIARAIAARPEILILDDSSSALDYKTDAALRRALATELADTTVVTVAQRVSSVKDCDLILVLDGGRIIGMGGHESLLAECPEYREISESQMGGAFVE